MGNSQWQQYFDQKAATHGASVKSSDYFDDDSFFVQRDHILQWIGPLAGKRILDAGCGVGAFSEPWTPSNTVVGVDFSAKSLEFAAKRGLQALDLGRSQTGSGTYRYKSQWGAQAVPLHYLRCGPAAGQSVANQRDKFQGAIALWRRLPRIVTDPAGRWLIPYLLP